MVSDCTPAVDKYNQELVRHGTSFFPLGCYSDDLSKSDVPWHWHEEIEAAVVIKGSTAVTIGSKTHIIGEGEGFFVNSGVLHDCRRIDQQDCFLRSVVFHPRLVGGSLESIFYQKYVLPVTENRSVEGMHLRNSIQWQKDAMEEINRAWIACAQEHSGYELTAREALGQFLDIMRRHMPAVDARPDAKEIRNWERIKHMLQFIHRRYGEEISTGAIAQSASVSESECLRCFRSTIGTTPIQYLREYRVGQAARLLGNTHIRIADIAAECGFQDVSYFTKTFREMTGVTPKIYRAREQSGAESGEDEL